MWYASVLALVVAATFAFHGTAQAQDQFGGLATTNQKCTCECTCSPQPQTACNIDVYFVLDAASCVKEQWGEMLLRMNLFARRANNKKHVTTRFSVIRFATTGVVDIPIDSNLNYNQFIAELTKLQWMNEGSFLNTGLDAVEAEMRRNNNNHKKVVLLVTNGKSHPDAVVDPEQLRRLSDNTGGQVYVNTLVPIEDNAFEESCDACDYNEKLFITEAKFDKKRQIISRDTLDSRVPEILSALCPLRPISSETECNQCECTCESSGRSRRGAVGYQGKRGEDGPQGEPGVNGAPGINGFAGIDGPIGADGCDGTGGNPGKHGTPGADGVRGDKGQSGVEGPRGPAGPPGNGNRSRRSVEGKGLPGFEGPMGDQGERGIDGLHGIDGPMGTVGLSGAEGDIGMPGERGEEGNNGQKGRDGEDGQPGYPGPVIPGLQGAPGERGPAGLRGPRGSDGPQGVQGEQGFCGKVGRSGTKGVQGMPGPTGPRGGIKLDSSQIEKKIRSGVQQILDKLLPESNVNRVCGDKCESYADYAENMYNQIIAIATEAPRPPTLAPVTQPDQPTTTEQDDYENYFDAGVDDTEAPPVVTERPVPHGGAGAVDLVFMIETSDYMLNLDWELVTSWVKRVITVAKSDPSKNVRSAIVIVRFNQSRHTMASLLERKIKQMKDVLQEDAIVQHIVSDTFEALEYANTQVYDNLRPGSKRVLITITDGMHRDWDDGSVSDANAEVLADTMTKYPVMIAIGLGSDVDAMSLGAFASHEDKIFIDVTAERLNDITQAVLAEVEFHDEPSK